MTTTIYSPRDVDQMRSMAAVMLHGHQTDGTGCQDVPMLLQREGDVMFAIECAQTLIVTFLAMAQHTRSVGPIVTQALEILQSPAPDNPQPWHVNAYLSAAHKVAHATAAMCTVHLGAEAALERARAQVEAYAVGDFGEDVIVE